MIKEIKTVKITEKGQIVIPKLMRMLKGFREGSRISVIAYDDKIELRPMEQVSGNGSDALFCMLASEESLAKNWLSKEDEEAWKDL